MCIIIDTNTLASVFKSSSINHHDFKPVLDWIISGKGKVVFGGTKYNSEIKKYLGIFKELNNMRKAVLINQETVDYHALVAANKIEHPDFDDQHLVGLLIASKCKLICSGDSRAYPFFTHKLFFNRAAKKPKIYASHRNSSLLNDRNIADVCKPCKTLNNSESEKVNLILKQ